jgi:hypothetical protein
MTKARFIIVALCIGLLVSVGTVAAANGGRHVSATLSGAAEVPGPGDPDGWGAVSISVNIGQSVVCYRLRVANIAPATAAHIHVGAAGVAGPVVVPLAAPTSGQSNGCASVSRELAKAILTEPANYYVNVHNADYPAGAVRGQLSK